MLIRNKEKERNLSESRTVIKQKMGAAAGISAPILAFACIITAIASDPSFSWTNNARASGVTGPLFNFGLYASGLLAFNFAVFGLYNCVGKSWVGKVGAAVFAAGTLALISIGVFNESFSGIHYFVSVAFFVLMPISTFILTFAFALSHRIKLAVFTVLIGVVAALPCLLWFAFKFTSNVAISETASGLAVSAWTLTICYKMIKQPRE